MAEELSTQLWAGNLTPYTTATAIQMDSNNTGILINPPSKVTGTITVTLPQFPADGQAVEIVLGGTISGSAVCDSLAVVAGYGQGFVASPFPATSPHGGVTYFFRYVTLIQSWFLVAINSASSVPGSGTVTSVGLSTPNVFTVSGSPVTTSGTLSFVATNATGYLLNTAGTLSWASAPSPTLTTNQIGYGIAGVLGSSSALTYDGTTLNFGIGASTFSMISGTVTINPDGAFVINGVSYNFPGSNSAGVLTNNGTGTLTWTASGSAPIYPSTLIPFGDGSTPGGVTDNSFYYNLSSQEFNVGGGNPVIEAYWSSGDQSIFYAGDIGGNGNSTAILLNDSISSIVLQAPNGTLNFTGSWVLNTVAYNWTNAQATVSGQSLVNDASGNISWESPNLNIVAYLTGQTEGTVTIGSYTNTDSANPHQYRINCIFNVTDSFSLSGATVTVNYTDENSNSQSLSIYTILSGGATLSTNLIINSATFAENVASTGIPIDIYVAPLATITVTAVISGSAVMNCGASIVLIN